MNERSQLLSTNNSGRSSKLARGLLGSLTFLGVSVLILLTVTTRKSHKEVTFGPLNVRLYTHNIRFDNRGPRDPGERAWSERKEILTPSIQWNTFAGDGNIVCLQEVLHNQLQDILFNLNNQNKTTDWDYYGIGRTDGHEKGEFAPILYKTKEWKVLDTQTFWLSETPERPSRGWDAALERIVTMVTLESKINPLVKLNFFNTHFDHRGVVARRESSKLIIDKMENHNEYPSFLCGDFNTEPVDEPYHILKKAGFKDSRTLVDELHHYGHSTTFTGFDDKSVVDSIIDYIWAPHFATNGNIDSSEGESVPEASIPQLHKTYKIKINNFAILENKYAFRMSDHRPVSADFEVVIGFAH